MAQELEVRELLGRVAVPTIVMHNRDNTAIPAEHGRYLAAHIPGARFIDFEGTDQLFMFENPDPVLVELETLVTGQPARQGSDREIVTVLFTDIVGSTEHAAAIGDRRWSDRVTTHHALVREQLQIFRGREIDVAGDGFFATFDAPARAITCACTIRDAVRSIGLDIRAGIHTGEVESTAHGVRGLAVNIGARVGARAGPGEVLVSRTVADLVAGSDVELRDRGEWELKGVPGTWRHFAVEA